MLISLPSLLELDPNHHHHIQLDSNLLPIFPSQQQLFNTTSNNNNPHQLQLQNIQQQLQLQKQQLPRVQSHHHQNLSINSVLSFQSSLLEPLTPPDLSNHLPKFSPWNNSSINSTPGYGNIAPNPLNHYTYQNGYNIPSSNSKLDLLLMNTNPDYHKNQIPQQHLQHHQKRVMSMPHLQPPLTFTGAGVSNGNKISFNTARSSSSSSSRSPPPVQIQYLRSHSVSLGMTPVGVQDKKLIDREMIMKLSTVPFESLRGEILSLSKDQYGCRFLQKKIEESISNFQLIFNEIYSHTFELMIDPFGNYLIQKILDYCSDLEKNVIVESCSSNLYSIALNQHGTRALQKMIDCVTTPYQISLIRDSLSLHVVDLIQDLNGNHVIQKCINKFVDHDCQFIIDSICQNVVVVSTHKHGCCVLQKCLNNCNLAQLRQLSDKIIENSIVLMQDQFGNYVVQYLLSINNYEVNEKLILKILPSIPLLSVQKFSSNVVEKCLKNSCNNISAQSKMIDVILQPQNLSLLMRDQFGNYVIQTSLDVATEEYKFKLIMSIRPMISSIKTTPFGRRIQSKISMILNSNQHLNNMTMISDTSSCQQPTNFFPNYKQQEQQSASNWSPRSENKPNGVMDLFDQTSYTTNFNGRNNNGSYFYKN